MDKPEAGDHRRVRLLIPDAVPISLLALLDQEQALDWLFALEVDVWVTDLVQAEVTREVPDESRQRAAARKRIEAWFAANVGRLKIQPTTSGKEYRNAMELWRRAGSPADLKPAPQRGGGDRSILDTLEVAEEIVAHDECVIIVTNDKRLRAAILATAETSIDLMGTETLIELLATDYGVDAARSAWAKIQARADGKAPDILEEDPVYYRPG
jgi:hypothetical protein